MGLLEVCNVGRWFYKRENAERPFIIVINRLVIVTESYGWRLDLLSPSIDIRQYFKKKILLLFIIIHLNANSISLWR